jgi:hypothetical protein
MGLGFPARVQGPTCHHDADRDPVNRFAGARIGSLGP